ncbi:o-succinylbenzoate--CoA ligase [Corynebacterium lujinxingii]|uniref:O-succinylbenzoate--CoA ligase n=1 Tax=Corynebacterium lujinxingii TaxID=2763010 RepID=A0A7H0JZL6_9CORY|nr:o-succinylbenzoate--CoA ligase [Corynebacterium lujinxingii]MBC3179658.1 o-succinylbenzoate--CoA ligase [Corynebacterium lujinxingii]NNO10351.1 o-succinylbenzoate--CoA ligase [Corynebacterium lujinxingii]QNP90482.1 o-succinylbenzoate--CoA ligase [Corynebacterium lujinxingii]
MTNLLELFSVDPANPLAIMPALEEALTGQRALLPVPANDPARTNLLRNTLEPGSPIDDDIALVVSTSGSTGKPKGAMLTPANLISSADATHQALGGEGQWLLAMPAAYIAGLQVLVRSMVAGVEPATIDLTRGFNVAEFAERAKELATTGERTYTALTPMQLAKATSTLKGIDALRTFSAVLVGGAATNPRLLESAAKLRINVITTYGSSETSGGCVYDGRPIAGARVKIVDGRIHLGGPMVARGYRQLDSPDLKDGWFRTSDAGSLIDDHLTVHGRIDNIIDSGGLKLHPEVLETFLLKVGGVTGACVVGKQDARFGERICAAYTGSATVADIMDAFDNAEDAGEIARWQVPKEVKVVPALPQLGPGKVDRAAVRELF